MYKTIGLYKEIENPDEFAEFYIQEIAPRLMRLPGVVKVEVTRLMPSPFRGSEEEERFFLMVETYYDSPQALQHSLQSPEGMEVARILMRNAGEFMTAYVGKSEEITEARDTHSS